MAANKYRVKVQSRLDNLESYRKRILLILKINGICLFFQRSIQKKYPLRRQVSDCMQIGVTNGNHYRVIQKLDKNDGNCFQMTFGSRSIQVALPWWNLIHWIKDFFHLKTQNLLPVLERETAASIPFGSLLLSYFGVFVCQENPTFLLFSNCF